MVLVYTTFLLLTGLSESTYGAFYWLDQQKFFPQSVRIGIGYGLNISNDYVENHSLLYSVDVFPMHFWSLGLTGQLGYGTASSSGQEIKNLEAIDIHSQIYALDGAVFATTGLDLLRGAWSFFNHGLVQSRFSLVAGGGWIHQQELSTKEDRNALSYFWKAETAFSIVEQAEFFVAFLGHSAERYVSTGLQISLGAKPRAQASH